MTMHSFSSDKLLHSWSLWLREEYV